MGRILVDTMYLHRLFEGDSALLDILEEHELTVSTISVVEAVTNIMRKNEREVSKFLFMLKESDIDIRSIEWMDYQKIAELKLKYGLPLADAVIAAAALSEHVDFLLTSDLKHFKKISRLLEVGGFDVLKKKHRKI